MYFKQIQLSGFKSFADRTSLHLEPGITAIVGPNGCGKSNVLDALRWALGEQSARALRGTHMQDVIFNGSENRQPTGMAEVSLTFDNADSQLPLDFAEVEVTRRVYRSGESEYLINKAPCLLRDIQELFMDTGIGTSAYSLIGQGKIDLILSSKPEDRRYVFEEAAGIIKYKTRKRTAVRRLDSAAQNILRLTDIVTEVQHQMRRLKRQVNAAIRYREIKNDLRELEIRAAWMKRTKLVKEATTLRKEFASAQDAFEKSSAQTDKLEARREELGLQRIDFERALAERREAVHGIDTEMEKVERVIALLRQQVEFSQEQQKVARQEHKALLNRAEDMAARMVKTASQAQEFGARLAAVKEELGQEQEAHEAASKGVAEADARLETARAKALDAVGVRAKTQTELDTLDVNIANVDAQLSAIGEGRDGHQRRSGELAAQLEEARGREREKQAAFDAASEELRALAESQASKAREMQSLNEMWQGLRERRGRDEARLHSLRELRDSYEGFATGVRAVMLAHREGPAALPGVIGPAGDLLSTDKAFERAIEAALGGNINNIVVETAEDAKEAIAFLKEERAGRVTFLPLDTIRVGLNDESDTLRGLAGVIGRALDHVRYDPHVAKAAEYLLYNTVIVETIDDAVRIARTKDSYPRMVTLDGEVIATSGAVTGGRTKHESRGLLGRSAEIGELEEKVRQTDAEIVSTADRGQAVADEIQAIEQRTREVQAQQSVLRRELGELGVLVARNTTEQEKLGEALDGLGRQEAELVSRRAKLEADRVQASERIVVVEGEEEALQRVIADAQQAAAAARDSLTRRAAELADLRVRMAEVTQAIEEVARNREREEGERNELLASAQQRNELADQHADAETRLEKEIAESIQRSKVLSKEKDSADKKSVDAQNKLQSVLTEMDDLNRTLRGLHEQVHSAREQAHQKEMALRHVEDRLAFFEERMLAEYSVDLDKLKAKDVGEDEYDEEVRDGLVADLRQKLERMGEVNMMAIEEYAELEQRHDFLVSQQQDLVQARDTLLSVIARIDGTIRDMFMDTFHKVSDYFHDFFRRLFNGGQARIYLLDEDDPLESGIEIEARPPGKKPQTIQLLSGGEQAMTAIALLFSIFKAKPSPFCVLDEVDAPLDDANIGRFLHMLDEFLDKSQFIIITHSKRSMAKANILYGVTMQERGVSQLVSVKFDHIEDSDTAA
ncbi:MAG TPA: chromosome segregation protein SMC [Candidatus Hydrogenedentes bacterium]|nr:chromosome segregation protein SMC [Candidatus Hydrogenedentota bacterium]HPG70264.1 chromosome segregation protein SMC [Candidatus Hydrogenedentota bacterium]